MSDNKTKANSFLSDLLEDQDDLMQEIKANNKKEDQAVQYIVYFIGEKPDTVWSYHHKPADGIPFGRLEGYWDEDVEKKKTRHYVPHQSKNIKLIAFDKFMDCVVPNKEQTKLYDSEEEFLLELI